MTPKTVPARALDRHGDLLAIIEEIVATDPPDRRALQRILKRYPKEGRGLYTNREILAAYRAAAPTRDWPVDEETFVARLRTCPTRSLSGVTPVTVLTEPFPCPGRCIFCPNDVRMPKSYVASEPGCQRAEMNRFDPYLQTWNRLQAYRELGHPTSKVELIVLGGTWSFYPEAYQVWFVRRCFEAMNDFGDRRDRREQVDARPEFAAEGPGLDGRDLRRSYNDVIGDRLREGAGMAQALRDSPADWEALTRAHERNEGAGSRAVGLVLETRPDHLPDAELTRLRRLGATKVQIGVQSLSDTVLQANRRGHDVAATRRAFTALRGAGFKIHAHWMANLYGSDPTADVADFRRLFDEPEFRPDELKVYPCSLVETAELYRYYEEGRWRPYTESELLDVLADCLGRVPRYCRVTRVVRDIPSHDIVDGNKMTNFRELAERRLRTEGRPPRDIRNREVRDRQVAAGALRLEDLTYRTSVGQEHFLQMVTPDDRIAAFLRLSLPDGDVGVAEIADSAMIREVHVYGLSTPFGARSEVRPQHAGLGRRLVDHARRLAREAGFTDLAVISAVGTRRYYRSLGFTDGPLYQHLAP